MIHGNIYLGYQKYFNQLNKVKIVKLSKVQILRSPKSFYSNNFRDNKNKRYYLVV